MPSPLALVPSFVSGARDVVSPVEEAENGLADRQREREKKGKKQRKGGIEIEGRPQERRLLLSSTSARVLAALMETRSRELPLTAAKPIYLRPRPLFPSLPPRFSVPSARCRSPPSGVSLRPAPAAFVIPLSLGRVPPAFQPVYKEDRVLHGDISLSRVLLGPREVEPERVAPAYARDPM